MIKMTKCNPPVWIAENWVQWGLDYEKTKKWSWRVGQPRYRQQLSLLLDCTNAHCSYCDNYPMGKRIIKPEIDHFKPKSKYPKIAYKWNNLFAVCRYCQERLDNFDPLLLKPDETDYSFKTYFEFDFNDYEIKPNRNASMSEKSRAMYTIRILKLNGDDKYKGTKEDVRLFRKEAFMRDKIQAASGNIQNLIFRYMYL